MKITRRAFLQAISAIPLLRLPSIPALQVQEDGTFPLEFPITFSTDPFESTHQAYHTYIPFYAAVGNPTYHDTPLYIHPPHFINNRVEQVELKRSNK